MKTFFLLAYGIVGLIGLSILLGIFIWWVFNTCKLDIDENRYFAERRKHERY